ncbi:MAG: bifunctional helix-turn-helix transcriptional regulator/GNAT family N-acetyltransferase [Bacteroidota bacterium]
MKDSLTQLGHLAGATRFRRISEKLHFDGDKVYKEAGIDFKASWFSVFYTLSKSAVPLTIMEIANQIDFTHITVKNVLNELKSAGLVEVKANPDDKRSKIASLSVAGQDLAKQMQPVWQKFTYALKSLFDEGHPDLINILNRIDNEIHRYGIHERIDDHADQLIVLDYRPDLKKYFYQLAQPWLLEVLNGELEEEDKYTLANPDKAYIEEGGFLFFAKYGEDIVGCVVLKRLSVDSFEFAKLFVKTQYRNLGIATKLIERCITRCKENQVKELWLQTTMSMPQAHKLYYKLGFDDQPAPKSMDVLERTEKIMCKRL